MELTDKAAKEAAACMQKAGLIQNPKGEVTFVKATGDLLTGGQLGGDVVVRGFEPESNSNRFPTQYKDLGRSDFSKAVDCVEAAVRPAITPGQETVAYKGK